jgi:hypothetical protein
MDELKYEFLGDFRVINLGLYSKSWNSSGDCDWVELASTVQNFQEVFNDAYRIMSSKFHCVRDSRRWQPASCCKPKRISVSFFDAAHHHQRGNASLHWRGEESSICVQSSASTRCLYSNNGFPHQNNCEMLAMPSARSGWASLIIANVPSSHCVDFKYLSHIPLVPLSRSTLLDDARRFHFVGRVCLDSLFFS